LKQICNHPALVQNRIDDFEDFQSGKWDLFKELLQESLESGQKVVVYSQFLNMIQIMERYLTHEAVDFVSLTGKPQTAKRSSNGSTMIPTVAYSWEASKPGAWALTWWPPRW
jgi:SNF2 family DNA or RNA helicase